MKNIESYLTNLGFTVDTCEKDRYLVYNDIMRFVIITPSQNSNDEYILKGSTISAFDRWANSEGIRKVFSSLDELLDFLINHKEEIYYPLLKYLSEEYDDLKSSFDELRDKYFN